MKTLTTITWSCLAAVLLAMSGCNDTRGSDAGFDAGPPADAGEAELCPTRGTPAPEELMGPCCWRFNNQDQLAAPELRLTFIDIQEPEGNLSSSTFRRVLNEAMQSEAFNWLVRVENAAADGAVNITTGFGRRGTDGTYAFSQGTGDDPPNWCPVAIDAMLAGETMTSDPIAGDITVPVFDETGAMLQVELTLRQIAIETATFTESRSCIGAKIRSAFAYEPAGVLSGFIEVEPSKTLVIDVPPINSTVCAVVAGSLSVATYCDDVPQGEWMSPPNALCSVAGCMANTPGATDVCDPATTCNAWRFEADFAASGIDITNGACP